MKYNRFYTPVGYLIIWYKSNVFSVILTDPSFLAKNKIPDRCVEPIILHVLPSDKIPGDLILIFKMYN
jgi:hypothetical protein